MPLQTPWHPNTHKFPLLHDEDTRIQNITWMDTDGNDLIIINVKYHVIIL